MHIIWFGLSSFKIITKDTTIFTDPFGKIAGPTPPRGGGNIVISSNPDSDLYNNFSSITGSPFVIDGPGEYDVRGVAVRGIPAGQSASTEPSAINDKTAKHYDRRTIYLLSLEGVNLGFLGGFSEKSLSESQIEELSDVDVLILPVGGNSVCNAEAAMAIVNELEPKVVIPMHYKTPGFNAKLDTIEKFLKEMGGKGEDMDKLLLKKGDLEEEKTKLIVLAPQRSA